MTSIASCSISCRTFAAGQPWPTTCSLRFSPEPRPSTKRSFDNSPSVAAFCATTAGWYRMVGQVTYVMSSTCSVTWVTAPSTDQGYGAWPWLSNQGK